ncbi:hypothetical protein [Streptomyces sp. NPDC046978]|uniref:hypothetical protein n=1 Tax=Streptomyces sp. NPDC046978 TaxID=3154704 RepID=UPI003400D186
MDVRIHVRRLRISDSHCESSFRRYPAGSQRGLFDDPIGAAYHGDGLLHGGGDGTGRGGPAGQYAAFLPGRGRADGAERSCDRATGRGGEHTS